MTPELTRPRGQTKSFLKTFFFLSMSSLGKGFTNVVYNFNFKTALIGHSLVKTATKCYSELTTSMAFYRD